MMTEHTFWDDFKLIYSWVSPLQIKAQNSKLISFCAQYKVSQKTKQNKTKQKQTQNDSN